jgi:hypothetical protein
MAPLPHDIVLLIAEHIESSELRSLALCHRYFLYEYLKQRYLRPVVVADSLQDEKCRRLLESNIARIRYVVVTTRLSELLRAHI